MAQHDYVIANASGASVRADINNMALAISSNNSGSSEPSTKYAYLWWLDSSANVLKLRNSANNAWITMPFSVTANNTVDINGGAIDGANIGASAAGTGAFTTLSASSTLGVTGVLTANAGVKVDNITIDGTTIALSSGSLTIDVASAIKLDADGGEIQFLDAGTEIGVLSMGNSNINIESKVANKDILFKGIDGSADVTALTLDMSENGSAIFNNTISCKNTFSITDGTTSAFLQTGSSLVQFGGSTNAPLIFYANNAEKMRIDASGRVFIKATGTAQPFQSQYNILGVGNGTFIAEDTGISGLFFNLLDTGTKYYAEGAGKMAGRIFFNKTNGSYTFQNTTVGGNAGATAGTLRSNMILTSNGQLTLSQPSGVSDITSNLLIQGGASNAITANFFTIQGAGWSGADPAMILGKHTGNNRSLNAGGTLNASGSDYAEYMYKADGCGTITKGEVCGVDVNGKLTKTFSNAISFVIKSTDPSYVGGDAWGSVDKGFTKEELEAERQKVDRIAFSGQVPVNITGSFNVGDYVYAQANSSGIKAVAKSTPTFEEYQLCVGKIWTTMEDGRPLVAVKIG